MFGYIAAETFHPKNKPEVKHTDFFREPTDGSLRYRPYGATPSNMFLDEALKQRQLHIDSEFQKLFDNPPEGVPEGFALMLSNDHLIGEQRRKMMNTMAYMKWHDKHEPVSAELHEKMNFMDRGNAFISESLDFAVETSVENLELGKLTHPYRRRLEHIGEFRTDTAEAIESHGGVVYPKIFPYHSLAIKPDVSYSRDGSHEINGFIVRYKRDFGHIDLPNNTGRLHLVERQIAGYRVDEASGFSQDVVRRMLAKKITSSQRWEDKYMEYIVDTGARGFILRAVQTDSLEDFVEPVSTTIYGYKELYTPTQRMAKVALGPTEDNGIAYFGPIHELNKDRI